MNNLFKEMSQRYDDELFDILVDSGRVKIERIVSRGHTSPKDGWYDQDRNEWVVVLRGMARLEFADGSVVDMRDGDHINIEAHRKHRVVWTDPDTETIWLAVHY